MEEQKQLKSDFMLAIFKSGFQKKNIAKQMRISAGYLNNMLTGEYNITKQHRKKLNSILKTKF